MLYTVNCELDDNTVCEPIGSYSSKREAQRIAALIAKTPASDVVAVLVMREEMVITEYKAKFTTRTPR